MFFQKKKEVHYNANVQGNLLTKCDRITERIEDFGNVFLNIQKEKNQAINEKDFRDFIKSIGIIVSTELNIKGVERKWTEKN